MKERKQKTWAKRLLVAMLSVMMAVTFIPTSLFAFAAEPEATPDDVQSNAQTEAVQNDEPQTQATEATKPAKEETKKSEPEEASTKHFTKELDEVIVDVDTEKDAFNEDVSLKVEPIKEGSKAYKKAEKALEDNEQVYAGMLAFDIHFENSEGEEIEPDGTVSVKLTAKEEALKDIAPNAFNADSVQVVHIGDKATEVVADTDENSKIKGTVDVTATKKAVKEIGAEFEVDSFSTFVLKWGKEPNEQSATIHYGYIDENDSFAEFTSEDMAPILDTSANNVSIANTFNGYNYRDAVYCAPGVDFDHGTSMLSELDKTEAGIWQYIQPENHDAGTPEQHVNIANGSNIYAVYYKPEESAPSGAGDATVPSPTATKNVKVNSDGTATIQLDIIGKSVSEDDSHYANVMIIFDATQSMSGDKWTHAKTAARTLVSTLTSGANAGNAGKIDFSFISFGRGATITNWGNNAVPETNGRWTKNESAVTTAINNLDMVTTSGTNWEAGMRAGVAALENVPDNDPLYIIFMTDGDPNTYYSNTQTTNYNDNGTMPGYRNSSTTSANRSMDEARTLAVAGNLYGIYCFDGQQADTSSASYTRLDGVITGQGQGGIKTIAATANTIESEFKAIAQTIIDFLGATNVSADDGIPELASVSADVSGAAGGYEYFISNDGQNYTTWADAPGASFSEDNGVTWDLSSAGVVDEGKYYRIKFKVWPSQEAYDIIANLNNGLVQYDDLDEDVKEQILEHDTDPKTYSLKTNTHYNINYSFQGTAYQDKVTDYPQGELPLVSHTMVVKKEWDDSINPRNRTDKVYFYLLADGKYYQNDGTFKESKQNAYKLLTQKEAWTASVKIAPGFAEIENNKLVVYEAGHNYVLEEVPSDDPEYEGYSQEFTSMTVRPMVIGGQLTYLVLDDDNYPAPTGATTYTIDGKTYYVQDVNEGENGTLTGTNHKTSELDITKVIDPDKATRTAEQLDAETFTYNVTFTVPEGGDTSGINYWIYTPGEKTDEIDAWTLPEYGSGNPGSGYGPESYTASTTYVGNKSSTTASGQTVTATVTITRDQIVRFTNLPTGTTYKIVETKANGKDVTTQGYVVKSVKSTNGTPSKTTIDNDTVTGTIEKNNTRYYNQYTNQLQTVDVNGTKTWVIGEGEETPASITIILTKVIGDVTETIPYVVGLVASEDIDIVATADPTNPNKWSFSIEDLDKYQNNVEVVYSIAEDVLEGFVSTQDGNDITNTKLYDVTVTKTFEGIPKDKVPAKFAITPVVGGETQDALKTTDEDVEKSEDGLTFTWTIKDVPYGTEVSATEAETDVTGYTLGEARTPGKITVTRNGQSLNFVNPYTKNTFDVTVVKTFKGLPKSKIPAGFTVTPSYDGTAQTALKLNDGTPSSDGLVYTWTLKDVEYGTKISVAESGTAVEGYTLDTTDSSYKATDELTVEATDEAQTLKLVNPYKINKYDVTVVKTFKGIPKGKVPAGFTVTPSYDGTAQTALKLSDGTPSTDGLVYTWTLEDVEYGTKVSVAESGTAVEGYTLDTTDSSYKATDELTVEATDEAQTLKLVNPYKINKYDLTVTKTFAGLSETEIPAGFTVTTSYDGTEQTALKLNDGTPSTDGLVYTWTLEDVEYGTKVSVVESGYEVTGYTATPTVNAKDGETAIELPEGSTTSATIDMPASENVSINFTNTYTYTDLVLTKSLDAYWNHSNNNEGKIYPSFAFRVWGYTSVDKEGNPTGTPAFDTVIGVDFKNFTNEDQERILSKLPAGIVAVKVEEIALGNYKPKNDPPVVITSKLEDDLENPYRKYFTVSFDNTLDTEDPPPEYMSGVVNSYERNGTNYEHPENSSGDSRRN